MKRVSSFIAIVVALSAAASAQDTATVNQVSGTANTVLIEQVGNIGMGMGGNQAIVIQGEGWYGGSGNNVQVLQNSVQGSRAEVRQSGNMNQYSVRQTQGGNLQATINLESPWQVNGPSDFNLVNIDQSGFDSIARVEQGGSMNGRADIMQSGWGGQNMAEIRQAGNNNQASIAQAGANLNASVVQGPGSFGNSATIRQGY